VGSHRRERRDAEEQYEQRGHQRAATHAGQTDEGADDKTGQWIDPVHGGRYSKRRRLRVIDPAASSSWARTASRGRDARAFPLTYPTISKSVFEKQAQLDVARRHARVMAERAAAVESGAPI